MELWEIVQSGDVEKFKELIAGGYDVNQGDEFGTTLLHHAARCGSREMIEVLLDRATNVNVTDSDEVTPLIEAVQECRKDIVQLLLDRGADPNRGRDMNGTAVHYAAASGELAIGRLLLEHGAQVNAIDNEADCWTPLHSAAYHGHLEFVKLLVESGANLYAIAGLSWPMDLALGKGHKDIAEYLYTTVEEPHPGTLGSPLHAAAGLRNVDLMRHFLNDGGETDVRDYASRTPLHWAVGEDRTLFFEIMLERLANKEACRLPEKFVRGDAHASIEFLVKKGADIEARDYLNNTPLLLALQWAQEDAAEDLIMRGADVNVADDTGWTPAILAASGRRIGVLKTLVRRGAKLDAIRDGWNALNYACHHGNEEAARFLLDCGMDVNGSGQHTYLPYPLFSAIFMGHTSIVRLLLERGADINVKDDKGSTAFSLARGKKEILSLLNDRRASDEKNLA